MVGTVGRVRSGDAGFAPESPPICSCSLGYQGLGPRASAIICCSLSSFTHGTEPSIRRDFEARGSVLSQIVTKGTACMKEALSYLAIIRKAMSAFSVRGHAPV